MQAKQQQSTHYWVGIWIKSIGHNKLVSGSRSKGLYRPLKVLEIGKWVENQASYRGYYFQMHFSICLGTTLFVFRDSPTAYLLLTS